MSDPINEQPEAEGEALGRISGCGRDEGLGVEGILLCTSGQTGLPVIGSLDELSLDFELLIVPGAEPTYIDCLAYVRKRCWDFLVGGLMGAPPPAYRRTPIAIDPGLLGELFA